MRIEDFKLRQDSRLWKRHALPHVCAGGRTFADRTFRIVCATLRDLILPNCTSSRTRSVLSRLAPNTLAHDSNICESLKPGVACVDTGIARAPISCCLFSQKFMPRPEHKFVQFVGKVKQMAYTLKSGRSPSTIMPIIWMIGRTSAKAERGCTDQHCCLRQLAPIGNGVGARDWPGPLKKAAQIQVQCTRSDRHNARDRQGCLGKVPHQRSPSP
jgi:hypothetical protein